jgi:hypothetical protein
MTTHDQIKKRIAEKDELFTFRLDCLESTADGEPLPSRLVWKRYQEWRKDNGLEKSAYGSIKGFCKALGGERKTVWDRKKGKTCRAFPNMRLRDE